VNRSLTVSGNTTLDIVCYGTCSACIVAVPGCTNFTAANYNPAATVDNGSCLYNTTFNVDMACAGVSFTNVYVTGPWCGWCGAESYNLLTDANGDGIYSGTVQLAAGNIEYKYMVDGWASQENLVDDMQNGGTCAPVTDYANYANRQGAIGSTFNDVYGRCSACPTALYNVTFQVDMSQQTGFTTPALNGNFNGWCGPCNPMTDVNGDGIWEITLQLAAGSYEYKFTADGWSMQENLTPGASCTVTNFGYTNRFLTVTNSDITQPVVCWGSCSSCSAPSYNVTFQVDMSQQTGFTTPELNGSFNGWCGNCNPMTDANGDGVWEITIPLQAGSYEYKFSADFWTTQESLQEGSSCTVTNFGYTNRTVVVSNSNITQPVVCWGSCSACAPIVVPGCTDSNAANYNPAATTSNGSCVYNHTFSVDMTCAGVNYTNVYVTGPWCGWCGADTYNLLTDGNGDGIYSTTVQLAAGNVEYKYMVDNWASQENLIDDMQNGGTCAPVTDYWAYANRLVVVGSVNSDVYGRCSACEVAIPGCTDSNAVNYNSSATTDNGTCLYATTFNVDMSCAGSFTNVYVTGPWCGWCGADVYNVMTDANADGIYSVTVNLAGTIEYKYMVDNWASQENLVDDMQNGGTCAPVTDYWSYANRTTAGGSTTNDVYGRCSACPILGCMNAIACNYDASATQDDGSCVLPALTYYIDTDNDGYGAGTSTLYCANPGVGYSSNNTDCNDAVASVNPGASEVCGNNFDDNCNGTVNEGCSVVPADEPSNATSIAQSQWPNCSSVSGTLVGATASSTAQTICLTGEDKWHQFVATSEAISIQVNSSAFDAVIELQSASGTLVASENAVSGIGSEILNIGGLTAGQVYKVGVRNYNSANGNGTYTICVKKLKRGGCDYGPGPYTLCQYFKASWAGGTGAQYRFTFTGLSGAASGNVYTKTQSTDICVLSTVTPTLPYGSSYNVLITTIYSLVDGAGNVETIEVPALSPCSLNTSPEAASQLRSTDNCTAGPRFRSAVVASLPWSCGAVNWRWEFIEVDGSNNPVGLPIYHLRGTASNYLNLGTVAALQYGKTYAVRTAPIFTYTGTNYNWGPVQYMCIVGQSGMITEGANAQGGDDVKDAQDLSENLNVYPNPTNGSDINIQLSNITSDNVQVRVLDAMGRVVFANRYAVDGMFTTNMTFDRPLANGLYLIEASFNGEVLTQRMMVQK
jgi:hypothetical protein